MKTTTPLPFKLRRPRLRIFPTLYGFLFLVVLVVMLIGSINYNNNLGFVLVFLLGGMGLISMMHTYRNLAQLDILSISAAPVFAGETAVFSIQVRSQSHRTAVSLSLGQGEKVLKSIPEGTDFCIDIGLATQKRGILQVGPLTIETLFPLGLFRAWAAIETDARCCVYPRPLTGPPVQMEGPGSTSENGKNKSPGVDDFAGLKTYRPGDPIRHISWKSLSRGLGVFTKDFNTEGRGSVIFDYDTIKGTDPEKKLSFLCNLILAASRINTLYGLHLPGKSISPDNGDRHRHRCLRALALFGNQEI